MSDQFSRSRLIFGREGMDRLARARVAVFGLGGVGGQAAEALCRGGIGALDLIDNDRICITNINRQIFATHQTLGLYKTEAARARLLDINPDLAVNIHNVFFLPETADSFDFSLYDYVVDAIDTVSGKIALVLKAQEAGVPVISAMGAGNKTDPTAFRVADIYETSYCPLCRVMRKELAARGVKSLKVVYSEEKPIRPIDDMAENGREAGANKRRQIPGSTSFVPPVAGLIAAGEVIKDLMK